MKTFITYSFDFFKDQGYLFKSFLYIFFTLMFLMKNSYVIRQSLNRSKKRKLEAKKFMNEGLLEVKNRRV